MDGWWSEGMEERERDGGRREEGQKNGGKRKGKLR